jgi:hypothetical protein
VTPNQQAFANGLFKVSFSFKREEPKNRRYLLHKRFGGRKIEDAKTDYSNRRSTHQPRPESRVRIVLRHGRQGARIAANVLPKESIMRALNLLFLALILAGTIHAQDTPAPTPANPSTVTVTQVSSRKEVFIPALYEDPMLANQDQRELERDQKATIRANAERARQNKDPLPMPGKKIASNTPVGDTPMGTALGEEPAGNRNLPAAEEPGPSKVHYVYTAKIKNTGEKTIRAIFWTYSLVDKETQTVLGRHRFRSNVYIRAGKSASLTARSKNPPAAVVSAAKSSKSEESKHGEYVTIDRIEYNDDTFWEPVETTNSPGSPGPTK